MSEQGWLQQALANWSATNAENSYWSLPQIIAQAYAQRGVNSSTPEGQSAINAATRGARYAQEGRINALRSQRGESPFDPMAAPPASPTSSDPNYTAPPTPYTPPITQGAPPPPTLSNRDPSGNSYRPGLSSWESQYAPSGYETSPATPGYSFAPGILPPANQAAFGADASAIQGQMTNLQNYLKSRYTGAAQSAGTLGNTAESKASIDADVNAGMPGAVMALQGQLDTAQQGAQGNVRQTAPSVAPSASKPLDDQAQKTSTTDVPQPSLGTGPSGVVSGAAPQKTSLNNQSRMKALQKKVQ